MDHRHQNHGRCSRRFFEDRRPDRRRPYFENRWPAGRGIGRHRVEEPRFEDPRVDDRRSEHHRFHDRRLEDRRFNDRGSENRGLDERRFGERSIDGRRPSLPIRLSPRRVANSRRSASLLRKQHDAFDARFQAQARSSPIPRTTNAGSQHDLRDNLEAVDNERKQEEREEFNWDNLETSMDPRPITVESSGSEEGQIKEREGQTDGEEEQPIKSEETEITFAQDIESQGKETTLEENPHPALDSNRDPHCQLQPTTSAEEHDCSGIPNFGLSDIPGRFVISFKFLQQYSLCSHIQSTYPSALWLEADFSDPEMLTSLGLASRCSEIDMVIAPNTVLLVTTLKRLHKRPVPGSVGEANILSTGKTSDPTAHVCVDFARVVQSYPFYGRTILLVSQGLPESPKNPVDMSQADARALHNLRSDLCTLGLHEERAFPGNVIVQYCPGGERELAKWIVLQMVTYGSADWLPGVYEGWTHTEDWVAQWT